MAAFLHLRVGIIPAYAGSTAPGAAASAGRRDHPRIRGEHVTSCFVSIALVGSSPHTRGARLKLSAPRRRIGIIPAYAGSTVTAVFHRRPTWDHPRIRGEHGQGEDGTVDGLGIIPAYAGSTSSSTSRPQRRSGSSPHTRGAPRQRKAPAPGERIIPAYAGSTFGRFDPNDRKTDHPRIRGEHDRTWLSYDPKYGSSPHTRGAP